MTKQDIRAQVRSAIAGMSADERARASARICATLVGSGEWQEARTVLLYAALPDEVETAPLIGFALAQGKRVLLPRVVGDGLELRFLPDADKTGPEAPGKGGAGVLKSGAFGIPEPDADCRLCTDFSTIDLAVIPGRAFTPEGVRLGRGKGFYDRFLASLTSRSDKARGEGPVTFGLAFPCQVFAELPADPWDISLDCILTSE